MLDSRGSTRCQIDVGVQVRFGVRSLGLIGRHNGWAQSSSKRAKPQFARIWWSVWALQRQKSNSRRRSSYLQPLNRKRELNPRDKPGDRDQAARCKPSGSTVIRQPGWSVNSPLQHHSALSGSSDVLYRQLSIVILGALWMTR